MRSTIFVNRSEPAAIHDYAMVLININERAWSRESHRGMDLPSTGQLDEEGGKMTLYDLEGSTALCTLHGLRLCRNRRVDISQGVVTWRRTPAGESRGGNWYLRAVDEQFGTAAHSDISI